MARRRKKSKKPPAPVAPKVDKSLPALPPQGDDSQRNTFTPDLDTPSEVFSEPTTTDASPRPPQPRRNDSSSNFRRDASPAPADYARRGESAPLTAIAVCTSLTITTSRQHDAAGYNVRQRSQTFRVDRGRRRRWHHAPLRTRPQSRARSLPLEQSESTVPRPVRARIEE
jgi:hypothetical protein